MPHKRVFFSGGDELAGRHEGYLIAVVRVNEWRWREAAEGDRDERTLQVACDCGWRSARVRAPEGARWIPSTGAVELPAADAGHRFDLQARALWWAHAREMRAGRLEAPGLSHGLLLDELEPVGW